MNYKDKRNELRKRDEEILNHNMEMTEKPTGNGAERWGFYLIGLLILAMGLTLNTKAGLGF